MFEVDHPATQAWKRARLQEAGISLPGNLTYAPVDFEGQTLANGLREAGYNPRQRAFFSWLGVTMYLTTQEVMATLRFIASAPAGSGVVFDYTVFPVVAGSRPAIDLRCPGKTGRLGQGALANVLPPCGKDLLAMGFGHVEDIGPAEINARYFEDRTDGLRVGSLAHIMDVRV